MSRKNDPCEIRIIRVYDAPVSAVWDAWTDPNQAAQWWGPRGFTITTHSKDLKVGGHWHYTMHSPDGVNYPNRTVYFEVVKHARLVYDHGANETQPALFRVTVDFSESNGKTTMEMAMRLPTPEAAKETAKFVKKAGGNGTWDRLAEYLEKSATDREIFVINRSFETSIETMFEMWINPKHMAAWTAPTGSTMRFIKQDIRVGGGAFYLMTNGGDMTMYGTTKYLEITRPHRIVYTQQFADEKENISRHPLAPVWPETMKTTVQFTEEGPSQTRVTLTWEPHGKVTQEELDIFIKAKGGMTQGWTGSLDKLEDYLPGKTVS